MVRRFHPGLAAAGAFVALVLLARSATSQIAITTWHYNTARSGANTSETLLTPGNVNVNSFGKLFTQPVDGSIIGQALYLPNVSIPGLGTHNVVYVATMHDSVYAFDADDANGANAAPLWHTSFLSPGVTSVPVALQGCGGVTKWTEVGVLSTPVIDAGSGTLFVVAKTYENNAMVHRLHALDVATGQEKPGSPVVLHGSYNFGGKTFVFQDAMQVNRPALLLNKGYIYIAFGSNGCRGSKEQGWVMAYNSTTMQYAGAFTTSPGAGGAGIWEKGGGPSADGNGNVYVETADGRFTPGSNFGMSVLKVKESKGAVKLLDWFTPFNVNYLDNNDLDMNDPILVLPTQAGTYPYLAIAVGKQGTLYVLNRKNMGHYCSNCGQTDSQIVQELQSLVGSETGALVYWNNTIYSSAVASPINAYALTDGLISAVPFASSVKSVGEHSPVLSANGNSGGILWQINGSTLVAYDAVTLQRLYSSNKAPNSRDVLPSLPHFANLVVVNGKVYVGTNSSLVVYGSF